MNGRAKRWFLSAVVYAILSLFAIIVIVPLVLIPLNSVKAISDFYVNPIGLPNVFEFRSYENAFVTAKLSHAYPNSLLILALCEAGLVLFGMMAAYPIARIKLRLNGWVFGVFLTGMIVPSQVLAVPLFILLRKLQLINSLTGISLVFIAALLPLTIFIYQGFLKGIPHELEEAAVLEGCGPWTLFVRVIVPLAKPTTATVVVLTSLDVWNNFFYPLLFLTEQSKMTLSVAIFAFKQFESAQWPDMFAAMVMIVLPIALLFAFMQKFLVKGIYGGALKG